ncbi:putative competence F domain protein [Wolbachia endosymbiont of Trichogramma pretiosum]|nr:putative competence F domain protein [Wolbachia endosymbiont of Trichogramma pretiosum]
MFQNAEVTIPIPLHKIRLFKRKYNQAALLAKELSKLSYLSYTPFAIKRIRHTVPQAGLSRICFPMFIIMLIINMIR